MKYKKDNQTYIDDYIWDKELKIEYNKDEIHPDYMIGLTALWALCDECNCYFTYDLTDLTGRDHIECPDCGKKFQLISY